MPSLAAVRNISIVATETGVDETTAKLHQLAAAQGGVAVASVKEEQATLSVDRALDRLRRSTDAAYRDTMRFEAGQKVLNRALDTGRIDVAEYGRQLDLLSAKYRSASGAQQGLRAGMAGMSGIKSFGGGFVFGATLAYLDPVNIARQMRDTISSLDDLGDAAQRAGVSGATLQVFRYQLEQGAGEAEDADKALEKFRKTVGELALTGKGPAAEAMKALGISIRDANGEVRTQDELFREVLRRMPLLKNEADAAAISIRLFGREGLAAGEAAREGSAGFQAAEDHLRSLNGLMTDEALDAVDDYDKAMKNLGVQVEGTWRGIVLNIADAIGQINDAVFSGPEAPMLGEAGGGALEGDKYRARQRLIEKLRRPSRSDPNTYRDLIAGPALPDITSGLHSEEELSVARKFAKQDLIDLLLARKEDNQEAERGIGVREREAESFEDIFTSYRRETEGMAEANESRGMTHEAILRQIEVRELEDDLIQRHIALTPDLVARINEEAEARVGATIAAEEQAKAQERSEQIARAGAEFTKSFVHDFRSEVEEGASALEALGSAGENALDRISDKLIDMAIDNLWANAFGGAKGNTGGLGGIFGSLFGGGLSAAPAGTTWGVTAGLHHQGGMVGAATSFRYVHPDYFDDAPRKHGGGNINWAAGERPLVGLLGERVLNRQETADYNRGRGDTPTQVKVENRVYNNAGAKVQTKVTSDGRGNIRLDTQIDEQVARALASPRTARAMRQNYGSQTRTERT